MNIGPVRPAPQFADFVAAAAARRAAGDIAPPAFRIAGALPLPTVGESDEPSFGAGPAVGYDETRALAEEQPSPATLDRSTALAAATRALRMLANAHGVAPRDAAQAIEIVSPREPHAHVAQGESAVETSLVVRDEQRGPISVDVHAARVAENIWQVAVFDRSAAGVSDAGAAAPPLLVTSAAFDPLRAEFVAAGMLAVFFAPRADRAVAAVARRPGLWMALVLFGTLVALATTLVSPSAGLAFIVALLAALRWLDRRPREGGGG